jgi:flagellar basal body-associated protein FliL
LKDLHKVKISETIASTIKQKPISKAISNALDINSYGIKPTLRTGFGSGATVVNYKPTITINGGSTRAKDEFAQMLKQHKDDILRIFKQENERQMRLAY